MPKPRRDRDFSYVFQPANRFPRPRQESRFALSRFESNRRTARQLADERHRQKLTLGKNTIQIVEISRNQAQPGTLPAQIVESALESCNFFASPARARGKQNQRLGVPHRCQHVLDRPPWISEPLRPLALLRMPRNQYGPKHIHRERLAQSCIPIVLCRNRPGHRADFRRQGCPQHHKVEMARVVRKVHGLPRIGFRIHPSHLYTADQACRRRDDPRHRMRSHRFLRSATIRNVRRAQVTSNPATMRTRARAMVCPPSPKSLSNAENTHAAVSSAIRWGLAMGPRKYCGTPIDPPSKD